MIFDKAAIPAIIFTILGAVIVYVMFGKWEPVACFVIGSAVGSFRVNFK